MQILEINDTCYKKLSEQAAKSGFSDVVAYIESLVDRDPIELRGGMTDEELHRSATDCDDIVRRLKKTNCSQDFRKAWVDLGQEFGFESTQ